MCLEDLVSGKGLPRSFRIGKFFELALANGLDQQADLDVRERQLVQRVRSSFGIHTRSSENRRSSSIGLAR